MKSLIVPLVIIVVLTALVLETKPLSCLRAGETNPAVTEIKLAESESRETESAETENENETLLTGSLPQKTMRPLPAAVSANTQKETKKLSAKTSENTLAEKETVEPFYRLYENEELEKISFEGTILASSVIPDPKKNDYENCLYALLVEIDSVLSDSPLCDTIERTVLINTPIMKNKKILSKNKLKTGDKVSCTCAEYDAMPQSIQEIQLSDDIQSFDHQQYYPLTIRKISSFMETGNKNFAKREISILPIQSLPKEEKAVSTRHDRIQKEIERIENELTKHGGSFESWKEEYKPIAEKYDHLCEEHFEGWINDSYFATGGKETSYSTKEYIDGILPYKKYLEENNIDLIVVRIPSKWDFAARVLASEDFQENPAWVEHYYQCLKNDIEIIDPMPEMWKERFSFPLFYYYNSASELHPFEGQAFVSAKELSTVLKRYSFQRAKKEISLSDSSLQINQDRYYWPGGNKKFDPQKNVVFKQVVQDDKTIGNLVASSGSPFLFLSNSFFRHPRREVGASVPGYTAYFIQAIPDWFYQEGTHNPMIRNLIARPQLLNSRKAVIMVGHPDDWKGFPSLPRYILDKAKRITLEKTIKASSDEITIHDNGSFSYSVDKNDAVLFIPNGATASRRTTHFDMDFKIPHIEGKKTCMVRVNFKKTYYISLNLTQDKTDTIMDTCSLAPGANCSADLFVPLSDRSTDVRILFQLKHYLREYSIQNIELWYY